MSFCANPSCAHLKNSLVSDNISAPAQVVFVTDNESENSVVSANSNVIEIFSSQDKKDQFLGSVPKTSPQAKLLQQIFSKNYNNVFISNSHKISSFLKNEICTRAP